MRACSAHLLACIPATCVLTHPLCTSFLLPRYDVSVIGRNGAASPGSNALIFVTPAANAPLNSGTARAATVVVVSISPPGLPPVNGGAPRAAPLAGLRLAVGLWPIELHSGCSYLKGVMPSFPRFTAYAQDPPLSNCCPQQTSLSAPFALQGRIRRDPVPCERPSARLCD